jgi:hypothetical protein
MYHWYDYNFSHIRFEIIFNDYTKLCSRLKHLVIDFLVAKDKIPSNVWFKIIKFWIKIEMMSKFA